MAAAASPRVTRSDSDGDRMPTLSLTLIVKNEEIHIPQVLANAHHFADEIVIVDTGSTDRTKEIARRYTDS